MARSNNNLAVQPGDTGRWAGGGRLSPLRLAGPKAGLATLGTLDTDERMAHNHRLDAVRATRTTHRHTWTTMSTPAELRAATGLCGRPRQFTSTYERSRVAVAKRSPQRFNASTITRETTRT